MTNLWKIATNITDDSVITVTYDSGLDGESVTESGGVEKVSAVDGLKIWFEDDGGRLFVLDNQEGTIGFASSDSALGEIESVTLSQEPDVDIELPDR